MCVSISATVALVCLFAPKIYIVLFQPHKNVRHGASMSTSSAYNKNPRAYLSAQLNFSAFTRPNGSVCNNNGQNNATEQQPQKQPQNTEIFSESMDELSCDEASAMKPETTAT